VKHLACSNLIGGLCEQVDGFFKKLRLRQILTVFLAGMLLIATAVVVPLLKAQTIHPAVQAGGANNPTSLVEIVTQT